MSTARSHRGAEEPDAALIPQNPVEATAEPAWEQIENGRYRPRRIRGSFRGRELG